MRRVPLAGALPALLSFFTVLVLGAAVVAALGKSPVDVGGDALQATLGTTYGLSQVLFRATPLILCGLAVALPLTAGLFNVGGEGQLVAGGLVAALVAQACAGLGGVLGCAVAVCAAALAGAAAGGACGLLRHARGVHEVIGTIMMNFILAAGAAWVLHGFAAEPGTSHTPELPADVLFSRLGAHVDSLRGSALSTSLIIALVLAGVLQWLLWRTVFGYELRASGLAPRSARHAGIRSSVMVVGSLALGGGLAGLAGAHFVLGARRFFEEGMSGGEGFLGIAVALMARSQPAAVVPAALLFAALSQAGLAVASQVPRELVLVLQGVVVLVLGGSAPWVTTLARRAREAGHG